MGFTLQNIKYGWTALLGVLLTGTTIYIANNTRHHVQQIDVIPIALGTYERCLATQTATNPTYSVNPPSFIRTWYTNSPYSVVTNSITNWYMARYTNVVTNTIGFYIDKPMMDDCDIEMKELPEYYTDAPAGGYTTNRDFLTVSNIFKSLGIGDKTNNFTSVPCWTNDAQVVYPINYTNYYPNTNAPTTNSFTSLYPETVRYAYGFWSNGYYWTNRLFSASNVITTTNVATYGNYAQQIYTTALEERYKFLWSLQKRITRNIPVDNLYTGGTDNVTSGQRYTALVTWSTWITYYDIAYDGTHGTFAKGTIPFAQKCWNADWFKGMADPPPSEDLRSQIGINWGTVSSFVLTNDIYSFTIVITQDTEDVYEGSYYCDYHTTVTVTTGTNAAVGASKSYTTNDYGEQASNPGLIKWHNSDVNIYAGTYYNRNHYLGLTPLAETVDSFCGNVNVTITGDRNDGGGNMPLTISDDSGGGGYWPNLTTNDSPFRAYSNSAFKSLLEINAGNLNIPDVVGEKTYSFNNLVGAIKCLVFYQNPTDMNDKSFVNNFFQYCKDKYW